MRNILIIGACAAAVLAGVACDDTPPEPTPTRASAKPKASASATASAGASGAPSGSASAAGSAAPAAPAVVQADEKVLPPLPPLPGMDVPADNPPTQEKIELGKILFFDKRLGKDGKFACENCHHEDKGWTDGKPLSEKGDGKMNTRHSPTLVNVGFQKAWYWDGRAPTLEAQITAAWKGQLGVGDKLDERVAEIAKVDKYKELFKAAFGEGDIKSEHVVKALASFVRTLRSGDSAWDKYEKGDKKAVSEAAVRGWEVFRGKASCAACHAPPLFTDNIFHNAGVGYDAKEPAGAAPAGVFPDMGRGAISKDEKDKGRFKTPTLRSVSLHPPYFHDGSAKKLEDAIDFMLGGGKPNDNLDGGLKKIDLGKDDRADLVAFVKALEGARPKFDKPKVP